MEQWLLKRFKSDLQDKCKQNLYAIQGAPDLSSAGSLAPTGAAPSYIEADFNLTKPTSRQTLPMRKTFVDKWAGSGVLEKYKTEFQAAEVAHNTEFNRGGVPYSGETLKRKAETNPEGDNATTVKPDDDTPDTLEKIQDHVLLSGGRACG